MRLLRAMLLLALLTIFQLGLTAHALTINVDCRLTFHMTITAAVAKIAAANPLGPNTITVTGNCHENVVISSLDNLTLRASPSGATITDASNGTVDTVAVADSGRFALNGFTINGSVDCFDNAVCRLNGNTIQNSQVGYGLRASRAHVDSQNDSISNNPSGVGVLVTNDSRVLLVDDTISNNGNHGIQVFNDAFVQLANVATTTTVSNNGGFGILARSNGNVRLSVANVTGNAFDGIRIVDGSVMRTDFANPFVNSITGNGGAGVHLGDLSHVFFANDGSINITGNLGGTDVFCSGQFSATRNVGATGGVTNCVEPVPDLLENK
jgi:Right handed beta helix region